MDKNSPILPIIGIVIALSAAAFGIYSLHKIPDNEYPEITPAFTLQGPDGTEKLSDSNGKVRLIFFGYAHCPDVCPATMVTFGQALDLLTDEERNKVKTLFVSLDPVRDSPEVMNKYVGFFHKDITGLSGTPDQTEAAAKSFLIAYQKDKANQIGNYSMNHSTYIYIVRPDGYMAKLMSHQSPPEDIAKVLRFWMKWAD
jgi:protein SCO1/2